MSTVSQPRVLGTEVSTDDVRRALAARVMLGEMRILVDGVAADTKRLDEQLSEIEESLRELADECLFSAPPDEVRAMLKTA